MNFQVVPKISSSPSLNNYLNKHFSEEDLLLTNRYILDKIVNPRTLSGEVLYLEDFGQGEPNNQMMEKLLKKTNKKEYKTIIAVGGGSVIDAAKLLVFEKVLSITELFETRDLPPKKRKLIVIPTTCGTGSEVTNISIIHFLEENTKKGLSSHQLFPDEAVLIGSLLSSLPLEVFATSSLDAFIHAIESYLSPKANTFTRTCSSKAIEIILKGYQEIVEKDKSISMELLQSFLEASTLAGIAFSNAGCASVHALSYPLGAKYHIPHGKSNYLVFYNVIKRYKELGASLDKLECLLVPILKCDQAETWKKLENITEKMIKREPLSTFGIDQKEARFLARSVIQNQQRLLKNNPISFNEEDVYNIYLNCL